MRKKQGRGACSAVVKAYHKPSDKVFAVKQFKIADKDKRGQLVNDIRVFLNAEDCAHLVKLHSAYVTYYFVIYKNMFSTFQKWFCNYQFCLGIKFCFQLLKIYFETIQ